MTEGSRRVNNAPLGSPADFVEALGRVAWADVSHAYGPATDVPELMLQALRGGSWTDEAITELWGSICHQGTVYSATTASMPFVGYLARDRNLSEEQRYQFLFLLFACGRGRGYLEVHANVLERLGSLPGDAAQQEIAEQGWVSDVHDAVANEAQLCLAELPNLRGLLGRASAILIAVAGAESVRLSTVWDPQAEQSEFVRAGLPLLARLSAGEVLPVTAIGPLLEQDEELAFFWEQRLDDAGADGLDPIDTIALDSYFVDILAERLTAL
jgi:hypothetical protein